MTSYDPAKVQLSVNGWIIFGFANEPILVKYADQDEVKEFVGIKGEHSFTENLDQSAYISFSIKQSAIATLQMLETLRASKTPFSVLLKDTSSSTLTLSATDARIKNRPSDKRSVEETSLLYVIACPKLQRSHL